MKTAVLLCLLVLKLILAGGSSIRENLLSQDVVALFSLDEEEEVAELQVFVEDKTTGEVFPYSSGRIELWRENHALMMNVSDTSELSVSVRHSNTYLWASVYDDKGNWIAESNVLHTGFRAGVRTMIHEAVSNAVWVDGDQIHFDVLIELLEDFESFMISKGVIVIDNQTVGMMSIEHTFDRSNPSGTFTYHHHGEVEVGRHTLSIALLYPGQGTPCALSPQLWFEVRAKSLERLEFESEQIIKADTSFIDENCVNEFVACVVKREAKIPPNRQYTEVLDGADFCFSSLCEHFQAREDRELIFKTLTDRSMQEAMTLHFSAILQGFKVSENFLRAGRALQCIGQLKMALKAYRTVMRLVGYSSRPLTKAQCTYPGCNEISKDTCNIMNRLLHQMQDLSSDFSPGGAANSSESFRSYKSHLSDILPPSSCSSSSSSSCSSSSALHIPKHILRYNLDDIVFCCLTTATTYRSRAGIVASTWWPHARFRYFYGDKEDADLPVTEFTIVKELKEKSEDARYLWEEIMAADYASSLPKFFMALLDMYTRHPNASWFFLGGDDNFVVPVNLLHQLQPLNADEKLVVGGPLGHHLGVGNYLSGGSGIVFSRGFMLATYRKLIPFTVSWRRVRGKHMLCHPCADVAFGFLANDVGAKMVEIPCMHGMWPEYFALHSTRHVPGCLSRARVRYPQISCDRYCTPGDELGGQLRKDI